MPLLKSLLILILLSSSPLHAENQQLLHLQLSSATHTLENLNRPDMACVLGHFNTQYVSHDLRETRRGSKASIKSYLQAACGEKHSPNVQKHLSGNSSEFDRTFHAFQTISKCLEIPVEALYAIWIQETQCGLDSTSPNGVGPLQFTTAGVTEVNDQLGLREGQARESAIKYFQSSFQCVHKLYPMNQLIWFDRNDFNNKLAESALYAAALLKVYFSVEVNEGGCKTADFTGIEHAQNAPSSTTNKDQCWANVFRRYNGHPEHRDKYARNTSRYIRDMLQQKKFEPQEE